MLDFSHQNAVHLTACLREAFSKGDPRNRYFPHQLIVELSGRKDVSAETRILLNQVIKGVQ